MRAAAWVGVLVGLACSNGRTPAPTLDQTHPAPIPAASTQLITTVVADWTATTGVMQVWHRARGTLVWKADGEGWPVVVGRAGSGWGRGLHGDAAPDGRAGPIKIEGDGKSPAGAFELRGAYGYAAEAPPGTALPYAQLTADTECIDDPASRHYTQILRARADRRRLDVVRAHAPRRRGLHLGDRRRAQPRGGARRRQLHLPARVARRARRDLWLHRDARGAPARAAQTLSPSAAPVYVLLPRADYAALQRTAWALPALEASAKVAP